MTRRTRTFLLALAASVPAVALADDPIPTRGFGSASHHWRRLKLERFIEPTLDQPAYRPEQFREIAANILLFQREDGGWPTNYDMTAILTPDQREAVAATRSRRDSSFDNGNVHSQVAYLARAYAREPEPAWRSACERGLDHMLAAQLPNGGFPQSPGAKGYHAHITFNDGVMIGILDVLADAALGEPHFAWLDDARRARCREAMGRGVACILKCQIVVDGVATGWCQQHDENTYEPRPARTFEPASNCPQETAEIVAFLTRVEPTEAIVAAVESAAAWLRRTELTGIRVERVKAPAESFARHDADFDVVVVPDPSAPPIWARHYEIGTDRPIFLGRDAVKRYALAEIERERRTGTAWYGAWPTPVLEDVVPRWRAERLGR
ncbi:MAG: pectate lyase [Planctomycetales bacterium 71-10]|nr:MAG: pectate lyase [Planctomycetales bacterium 71-10]